MQIRNSIALLLGAMWLTAIQLPGQRFAELAGEHVPADASHPVPEQSAGDIDGDGDIDVVANPYVFINDGHGVFRDEGATWFSQGASTGELVDLDGDGDLDLAVPLGSDGVRAALNQGSYFAAPTPIGIVPPGGFSSYYVITPFDADGDGAVDLLCSGNYSTKLFFNDGAGQFAETTLPFPKISNLSYGIAFAINGDGHPDLLLSVHLSSTQYTRLLLLNDGSGGFTGVAGSLPDDSDSWSGLADLDFDGDGDRDVLVSNHSGTNRPMLLQNDGTGKFSDVSNEWLPALEHGYARALAADFDGDAKPEIFFSHRSYRHAVRLDLEDGRYALCRTCPGEQRPTERLLAFDADGDGDLDLWSTVEGNRSYELGPPDIWFNDGTGQLRSGTDGGFPMSGEYNLPVAIDDFDGDGHPDILVLSETITYDYVARLLHNDGHGDFTASTPWLDKFSRAPASPMGVGDLDNDGDLDVVPGRSPCAVMLNDGTGRFTPLPGGLPGSAGSATQSLVVDIDADGALDIVCTYGYGLPPQVWTGDNQGGLTECTATCLPGALGDNRYVTAADFDLDGDLDLAFPEQAQLFLNDGSGKFTDHGATRLPGTGGRALLGDFDGNGAVDLWVDDSSLWLNNGEGYFVSGDKLIFGGLYPPGGDYRPIDVDADGDLDLASPRRQEVYLNDGRAFFTRSTEPVFDARDDDVASFWTAADIDQDGDLDAITTKRGLFRNLERQIHLSLLLRLGAWSELEIYARPERYDAPQMAHLIVGLDPIRKVYPRHGTLLVDLATATILPPIVIPEHVGKTSLSLFVPHAPALQGVELRIQALIDHLPLGQSRLSNLILAPIH